MVQEERRINHVETYRQFIAPDIELAEFNTHSFFDSLLACHPKCSPANIDARDFEVNARSPRESPEPQRNIARAGGNVEHAQPVAVLRAGQLSNGPPESLSTAA